MQAAPQETPVPAGAEKPGRDGRRAAARVLGKAILALAALFVAQVVGTIVGLLLDLSGDGVELCGYVAAAALALFLMRRMGAGSALKADRHVLSFALDRCGWLLAVNLVLGLITLMPDDGQGLHLAHGWIAAVIFTLVECALIGIVEECAFRGLLLGGLLARAGSTRKGVILGALLSAAIFGLAHVIGAGDLSPLGLVQALLKAVQAGIIGAAFAAVALTSGSIAGTALVHALFDFLVMAPVAALGGSASQVEYVASGAEGVATALSYLLMIVIYLPQAYLTWQMLEELEVPQRGWFMKPDGTPLHDEHAAAPVPPAASGAGPQPPAGVSRASGASPRPGGVGPCAPDVAAGDGGAGFRTQAAPAPQPQGAWSAPARHGYPGVFITLEGIDGSGKSTQAELLAQKVESLGVEVVRLREPGATPISEKIRALLLDPANDDMADECELLLYEASRAQLVRQTIEPALARGAVVICDRFYDSTSAYQAGGRGLPRALVDEANALGSCGIAPDRTLVFDISADHALARATVGGADRLEAEGTAFEERVRSSYLRLALSDPERIRVVDATGTPEEVASRVVQALNDVLARLEEASHAQD